MRLTYISIGVTPESRSRFMEIEMFAQFVCEEYRVKLAALCDDGHCVTKNVHRAAIEVRNAPSSPWTAYGVFTYGVRGESLVDASGRPSKRRITDTIRDALLCCAAEQGLDTRKIMLAHDLIDPDLLHFDCEWKIKSKGKRRNYPTLSVFTRMDNTAVYIIAASRDQDQVRYYLMAKAGPGVMAWTNKLGYFEWRSHNQFCLMGRKGDEIACQSTMGGARSIDDLISALPNSPPPH